MKTSEEQQFGEILRDVMAFYKQDVTPFSFSVWWQTCQKYDIEQVRKVFTSHVMDAERGMFPPKPADLVRQLEGTATDKAMLAWGKAYEAMQSVGAYTDVVFDDAAIHATIEDLGGWPKICRSETKDLGYLQHRFCEFHRAYSERGQFDYPKRLCGERSPDHEFTSRGLPVPKPVVIGDVEKARIVYRNGVTGAKTRMSLGIILSQMQLEGRNHD